MNPVYAYVPNLIGYARVLSGVAAFAYALHEPATFLWLYTISYVLDAFDGYAARALGQCECPTTTLAVAPLFFTSTVAFPATSGSDFGAVLDMLTDRIATLCLYIVLGHIYVPYFLWFMALASLDIVSHWVHTHSTQLLKGGSHKSLGAGDNALLRAYYTMPGFMLVLCVGQEVCLLALYAMHAFHGWETGVEGLGSTAAIALAMAPLALLKQVVNVVQMAVAFDKIAASDAAGRTTTANTKAA